MSEPRKRILMVEDDADTRCLNSEDLRNAGYSWMPSKMAMPLGKCFNSTAIIC